MPFKAHNPKLCVQHVDAVVPIDGESTAQEAQRHAAQLPDERRNRLALDLVLRQARLLTFLGRLPQALELLLGVQRDLEHLQEPALEGLCPARYDL